MNGVSRSPRVGVFFAALLCVACPPRAEAVMVATTTGNTTAPADDFGFANVGVKDSTAVYLGYRWVLTAAHTGAADTTFNGTTYRYESGTDTRLTNPAGLGLSPLSDLRLYRITEDPWLPTLAIADGTMNVWDEVVMVGNGLGRSDTAQAWDISGDYPAEGTWVWTVTTPPGDAQGYAMGGTQTLRWGTNRVEPSRFPVSLSETNSFMAFKTDFDQYDATEFEAQAASGDSGGGVFHKNGDRWELVGTLNAVTTFPNQPSSCIFGHETYCADLSLYRDQIVSIITPLGGDANLDGFVDAADASIMSANWGRDSGVLWGHGDFNEDGTINNSDAAILADNWGTTSAAWQPAEAAGPMVPEPAALVLLVVGLLGLLARRATIKR